MKFKMSDILFKTLLESAPDAMVIVGGHGEITIVNAQAESMFGYNRKELIGQSIETLLPGRLRKQHTAYRSGFSRSPSLRPMGTNLNLVGRRKDGSEFPVEISLSPIDSESGQLVSSVIRDVTRRKKMEQEIIAARQTAERANKANSAFLAAASHDLRQPVQALSLLNGALRRTVKDARALEMIEHQQLSLTAMTNLLNSLLDISRLDAGAIAPDFEEFPMQRLIDRLSAEFGRRAKAKNLKFSAGRCNALVRSDPNLLAEIIQNLVSNAIRYTDAGEVSLVCDAVGGECQLRVIDTGIGIEPGELDEIFREFHQCNRPGVTNEGSGLGLAIVRRLANLLEHRVTVTSVPGKGSEFSVSVPRVADEMASDRESDEALRADAAADSSASGLVVLIEDDVNVANAWELLLEAEGYRVATAASALEAKALIRHLDEVPALLISDFHLLDGSTGVEAVEHIREYYEIAIPVFIVSGDTSKVVKDARLLENCTLMNKPVDTTRMLTAARSATRTGVVPAD